MRMLSRILLVLLSLLALRGAGAADPLELELVAENRSIQPGRPFTVALRLIHAEGFHTYWMHPGIVGLPTAIEWKLPEGWKAGPIQWPSPERVMMFQIKAQGYHGEVLLPVEITPPAAAGAARKADGDDRLPVPNGDPSATSAGGAGGAGGAGADRDRVPVPNGAHGAPSASASAAVHDRLPVPIETPPATVTPVTLAARVSWMCCGTSCFPGFKDLHLELPVSAAVPITDPRWRKAFKGTRTGRARPSDDWTVVAECSSQPPTLTLRIRPRTEAARVHLRGIGQVTFFTADGLTDPNLAERFERTDTEIVVTQGISKFAPKPFPQRVVGIVSTPQGWSVGKEAALEVDVPVSAVGLGESR